MENILYQTAEIINAQILDRVFLNNTVLEYLIAVGVFLIALIILKIVKVILLARIKEIAKGTKNDFDDLILKIVDFIGWPFYFFFALFFAIKFVFLPKILISTVYYVLFLLAIYYIVRGIQTLIDYGFDKAIKKRGETDKGKFDPTIITLFKKIVKAGLWGIAVVIFLQNLGYDITALIAGLGIGGLAIAFALQNILSDIFSSFTIYFDKPFEVGDFIIIGKDMGTVKKIGIKSTRIQTLQGQELVVSNQELTSVRVNNYKKMQKRRIVFEFGVAYETPTEKVKKIPEMIKRIMEKIDLADLDRAHFNKFSDSSLNFEVVYYLNSSEYNDYMDVQQEINLAIKSTLEKEKINFAYPTQTIYLNK